MFTRLCAVLLLAALAAGCGGGSAEVPKNPVPKPDSGPGSSFNEGQGGKNQPLGEGARKL